MRKSEYRPAPPMPRPSRVLVITYRCDKCGKEISREDNYGDYAHELMISLDQDECVSYLRQRDYCPDCIEGIWNAINEIIGADPGAERERDE